MLISESSADEPPLRTFPRSHKLRKRVETWFALGKFQRILCERSGELGQCNKTVEQRVHKCGGGPAWGWLIVFWPRLYVEALYHCAWRSPDGRLIDLSKKYPGDLSTFSTFVCDETHDAGYDKPSRYFTISESLEVKALISAAEDEIETRRNLLRICKVQGRLPTDLELALLWKLRRRVEYCIDACR